MVAEMEHGGDPPRLGPIIADMGQLSDDRTVTSGESLAELAEKLESATRR